MVTLVIDVYVQKHAWIRQRNLVVRRNVKILTIEDRINPVNIVNIIADDALAPCVASTSAPMIVTI